MERINRPLAEALRALLLLHLQEDGSFFLPSKITFKELIRIAKVALGDELTYYTATDELVWDVARHEGYVIPANPVESRGDAQEFLAEHQVKNSKEWYIKRGFAPRQLQQLFTMGAFMARNKAFWRKIIPLEKTEMTSINALAPKLIEAIDFCLEENDGAQDATLFKI